MITRTSIALFIVILVLIIICISQYVIIGKKNTEINELNDNNNSLLIDNNRLINALEQNKEVSSKVILSLQESLKQAQLKQDELIKQYESQLLILSNAKETLVPVIDNNDNKNNKDKATIGIDFDTSSKLLESINDIMINTVK